MTPEQINDVLARIEEGESQSEIARSYRISAGRLSQILSADEEIAKRSARARSISAEAWLDRGLNALIEADGDSAEIARARYIAQECARRAALRNPAYRESNKTELTGPNGGPMQIERIERVIVGSKAT